MGFCFWLGVLLHGHFDQAQNVFHLSGQVFRGPTPGDVERNRHVVDAENGRHAATVRFVDLKQLDSFFD